MSRLILVSNRLPVTVTRAESGFSVQRSVGGLATALGSSHQTGESLWVGWPGGTEDLDVRDAAALDRELAGAGFVPVGLSEEEVRRYYGGYCNEVLWPLFHYLTGVPPLRVTGWPEYRAVNARFADAVASHYREGDLVWVHDYHLMLLPELLRQRLPRARVGFFLHIPFPSSELFATLPDREELLRGLLGADLIGFHTVDYVRHFTTTAARVLGLDHGTDRIRLDGREVRLGVFPVGADNAAFEARARDAEVEHEVEQLRSDSPGKLLVGIDRLDYTKGIPRRLLALEELLGRWPEWRGRLRLIQVAVPSRSDVRAYRRFRHEVEALVGRINGAFGTAHWMPIHYVHRGFRPSEVSALYRAADVMLVTPVRDGMNLVAKEFVVSRVDEDGVLVLSEFAGAAAELSDALLVNPFDLGQSARAYYQALTMPAEERRARMRRLRESVLSYDVFRWVESFLEALGAVSGDRRARSSGAVHDR